MIFHHKLIITSILLTLTINCCNNNEVEPDCSPLPNNIVLTETQAFFLDLAFEEEFGESSDRLRKWNSPINIFIEGSASNDVLAEANLVISELNSLSSEITINTVQNVENANLRLFFGSKEDYVRLVEPGAAGLAEGNSGFAAIDFNSDNEITRASACVDVVNVADFELLRHIIREELAQTLGLINDSVLEDNSVFHQFLSTATSYSNLDELMISFMLGNELQPGMCREEVLNVIDF